MIGGVQCLGAELGGLDSTFEGSYRSGKASALSDPPSAEYE